MNDVLLLYLGAFLFVMGITIVMTKRNSIIVLLGIEVVKATRMGIRGLMDHILSMVLFIVMLVEFLLVARAGTSTFFILMVISLVDVLAGFIITARTAQRDIQIDRTVDPTV